MGRSPCCDKEGLKKGPWIPEEDEKLVQYIHTHGPGNWRTLPKKAGLQRCGKSCRLRWINYLRPDIKRGRFSFEEEEFIIQLHSIMGNKWSAIAARLPGRTDNEIKNYWNTHIRKRLLKMGIDPVTHSPHLDLPDLSSILSSNQINHSSLLGLHTLLNPVVARLFTTLLASNHQNPEMLLQNLKQNQLMINTEMQNLSPQNFQPTSSSFPMAPLIQQTLGMDLMSCENFQNNLAASNLDGNFGVLQNNFSNFPSTDNSQETSQNFAVDSLLSTPMSSPTPLSSSSTFINNGSTEDEKESYYSNMFKFDIPEGLDLDDFM